MMNPIIASFSELIKMFAELFRVAFLFPAMVFTLLNGIVILPHFTSLSLIQEFTKYNRSDKMLIGILLALLLGYIMNAVEDPIALLFKGIIWNKTWFGQWLTERQRERRTALKQQYPHAADYSFPSFDTVLPTALGNIIAAYESYPMQTYRMTPDFWARMHPILVKNNFLPHIAGQRSSADFLNFLLNSSLLLGIFGFECLAVRVCVHKLPVIIPLAAFVLSCLFYRAAIYRAYQWGETYRAAFDLYRYQLAEALGLKPVKSFMEELNMWYDVSKFWRYQSNPRFDQFNYDGKAWPVTNSDKQKT